MGGCRVARKREGKEKEGKRWSTDWPGSALQQLANAPIDLTRAEARASLGTAAKRAGARATPPRRRVVAPPRRRKRRERRRALSGPAAAAPDIDEAGAAGARTAAGSRAAPEMFHEIDMNSVAEGGRARLAPRRPREGQS